MKKNKKKVFLLSKLYFSKLKSFYIQSFLNLIICVLWKSEEDCLKNDGDRFLVKWSFCAFLVCAFHKEPIEVTDFAYISKITLYLKIPESWDKTL